MEVIYIEANEQSIELIGPLWEQLNEQHRLSSPHFKSHYETFIFEKRKKDLLDKAKNGLMHIVLAKDTDGGRYIGYSISTLSMDSDLAAGEVDSIFVEKAYRSHGIGDLLMKKSLKWMEGQGASVIRVSVAAGNEAVWPFYERYGFYPRSTMLEQVKK